MDCDRHANQRRTALFSIESRGRSSWFLQTPFTAVPIHPRLGGKEAVRLHSGMLNSWTPVRSPISAHPKAGASPADRVDPVHVHLVEGSRGGRPCRIPPR